MFFFKITDISNSSKKGKNLKKFFFLISTKIPNIFGLIFSIFRKTYLINFFDLIASPKIHIDRFRLDQNQLRSLGSKQFLWHDFQTEHNISIQEKLGVSDRLSCFEIVTFPLPTEARKNMNLNVQLEFYSDRISITVLRM